MEVINKIKELRNIYKKCSFGGVVFKHCKYNVFTLKGFEDKFNIFQIKYKL
jgi:hypothetical protein